MLTVTTRVISSGELYCCLLPQCEVLRTCHSCFPITTIVLCNCHNTMCVARRQPGPWTPNYIISIICLPFCQFYKKVIPRWKYQYNMCVICTITCISHKVCFHQSFLANSVLKALVGLSQHFSTFLLQRNLPQMFALLMKPYAMIQVSILLQPHRIAVTNFVPGNFDLFWRNPWQPLAEPWGSAEPRLKNTGLSNCALDPFKTCDSVSLPVCDYTVQSPIKVKHFKLSARVKMHQTAWSSVSWNAEKHQWLLGEEVDILSHILLPLAGGEEFTDEENDALPLDLQFLPSDKVRESDPDIRKLLVETVMLVGTWSWLLCLCEWR